VVFTFRSFNPRVQLVIDDFDHASGHSHNFLDKESGSGKVDHRLIRSCDSPDKANRSIVRREKKAGLMG
jgi:hypothetical protein